MHIRGNYQSPEARLIEVQLKKCHNRTDCKSPEEIRQFLRNKFILFHYNQIRFDHSVKGNDAIIKESRIDWQLINTQIQQTIEY